MVGRVFHFYFPCSRDTNTHMCAERDRERNQVLVLCFMAILTRDFIVTNLLRTSNSPNTRTLLPAERAKKQQELDGESCFQIACMVFGIVDSVCNFMRPTIGGCGALKCTERLKGRSPLDIRYSSVRRSKARTAILPSTPVLVYSSDSESRPKTWELPTDVVSKPSRELNGVSVSCPYLMSKVSRKRN